MFVLTYLTKKEANFFKKKKKRKKEKKRKEQNRTEKDNLKSQWLLDHGTEGVQSRISHESQNQSKNV